MTRNPYVSGTFYPSHAAELKNFIASCTPKKTAQITAQGMILPHAGYIYSGEVAIATVAGVLPKKRVLILGPNHMGLGEPFSIYPQGAWNTPLGLVSIDEDLTMRMVNTSLFLKRDATAHQCEHSIEVELPILQYFWGDFRFVPLCCQIASAQEYRQIAQQIYDALKDIKDDILIVASSDMTHYEPDSTARKKDRDAIESIIKLDDTELLKKVKKDNITMCGIAPVSIMLALTKLMGATKAEVVLYQTSGDITGDYSAVVGYLGAIIT